MPQSRRTVLVQLAATGVLAACDPEGKVGTPDDSALDSAKDTGKPEDSLPGDSRPGETGLGEQPFPEGLTDQCLTEAPQLEQCPPNPPWSEGPFYREGSPYRDNLDVRGEDATHIVVTGRVLSDDGCTPVAGAEVIVWHATPDEIYDNGDDFHCRGRVRCDDQGYYCFYSCRPVPYPNGDNTGYLPAHFHIHIYVVDKIVHTTQLYFEGDPYLEAFIPPALVKSEEEVEPGVMAITHDFSLPADSLN